MTTLEQIEQFSLFAKQLVEKEGAELPLDVIFDRWHEEAFQVEDLLRIQAAVQDYENGNRGQPADVVLAEFRSERAAGKQK